MDMMGLAAAFGGGLMGAYMGALPAFIMTGVLALVGAAATAAGAPSDITVGFLAFGSLTGPHISFAAGVAAAAYAGKTGRLEHGNDITKCLHGLTAPDVLIVGGIFGVIGFVIHWIIATKTPLGTVETLMTDLPGITVFISAIISRLVFTSSGLTGKYTGKGPRVWFSTGKVLAYNIVFGAGIGCMTGFIAAQLKNAGVSDAALGIFPVICFAFSAITLVFTQFGAAMPGTHHITLPSALAAVAGVQAWGASGAVLAIIFGVVASLLGDFFANTFNSHCDSHIDPPAMTIFLLTIVVNAMKPML